MISTLLLAAALLTDPAPGSTEPPPPIADLAARFYPVRAQRMEVEGRVVLVCRIDTDHTLSACQVIEETPPDYDFGDAALRMSKVLRMRPRTKDGQPVDGGQVRIPIAFTLPRSEEVSAEVMLDNFIQCYGVIGADLDANPASERLAPALPFLRKNALGVAVHAGVEPGEVDVRLKAARTGPSADEAFGRTCRTLVEDWLKGG
jgi:TonB family protein